MEEFMENHVQILQFPFFWNYYDGYEILCQNMMLKIQASKFLFSQLTTRQ